MSGDLAISLVSWLYMLPMLVCLRATWLRFDPEKDRPASGRLAGEADLLDLRYQIRRARLWKFTRGVLAMGSAVGIGIVLWFEHDARMGGFR